MPVSLFPGDEGTSKPRVCADHALRMCVNVLRLPEPLRTLMNRVWPDEALSLNRVVGLADKLAERTLSAIDNDELTTEEVRNSPDVALILQVAQMVLDAGTEFPPAMRRLAETATEPRQCSVMVVTDSPSRIEALIEKALSLMCRRAKAAICLSPSPGFG